MLLNETKKLEKLFTKKAKEKLKNPNLFERLTYFLKKNFFLILEEPVHVLFTQSVISGGLSNMHCINKSPFYLPFCLTTCNHFLSELDNEIGELICFNFLQSQDRFKTDFIFGYITFLNLVFNFLKLYTPQNCF